MLEVRNIYKTYRMGDTVLHALQDVSLTIEAGEFVAIMGPSGSGKSTLMNILGLLDTPSAGTYLLKGKEVGHLSENLLAQLRSRTIGFIFQQFNLLPRTSAELNVGLPLIYHSGEHDKNRCLALLKQVGLGARARHVPSELSGGQQQRVAIARALVNRPEIIFADEPTGSLDSSSEKEVMSLLHALNARGMTIVIVTHEPEIAAQVKRVIRMRDGKVQSDTINQEFRSITGEHLAALHPPQDGPQDQLLALPPRAPSFRLLRQITSYGQQALKSLVANKIRSFLSMLGILIGVAAVIAMVGVGQGASQSMETQLSSLGSNLLTVRSGGARSGGVSLGSGAASRMTLSDLEAIRGLSHVKAASANVSGRGQVVYENKNWSTSVVGTTTAYQVIKANTAKVGRFFNDDEDIARARVALLGKTVADELFSGKDPLGEYIKINRIVFQVIGILGEKGASGFGDQDDVVVIPIRTAMHRVFGKKYVDSFDIQVTEGHLMAEVETATRLLMNERHRVDSAESENAFSIRNMAEIREALSSVSRMMSLLLAVIASISLVVGGIGIMNIMLVTVTERTREIGLRKAIGATSMSIMTQFLVESVILSVVGGALGIGIGMGLAHVLSLMVGWVVIITWNAVFFAAGFSVVVGIIFGLWPARKASRLHPIEALRHE